MTTTLPDTTKPVTIPGEIVGELCRKDRSEGTRAGHTKGLGPGRQNLVPVRCFTCQKIIAHLCDVWEDWLRKRFLLPARTPEQRQTISRMQLAVLDEMGLRRDCCRRMFLTHPQSVTPQIPLRPCRASAASGAAAGAAARVGADHSWSFLKQSKGQQASPT
jgi:DNA-directed RNA polymerase subunit N (RpoN/RPB10)